MLSFTYRYRLPLLGVAMLLVTSMPLQAQEKAARSKPSVTDTMSLVGTWNGKATVPLGDSTIVVPVSYTFTQSGSSISGSAMVPGQGAGQISNVVREGARVRFRVTIAAALGGGETRLLDHDGTISASKDLEGTVNYNEKPVATFKISRASTK